MNMKERIYMLLQETVSDEKNCQWRKKLEKQLEVKGNEKAFDSQARPTERKYDLIDYR
jgi:hypothetical protein